MGLLRFYLAICVVIAHSSPVFPWAMLDGRQAVQLFFLISGFYMQFVLVTKYASYRQFYIGRFLRIFVPYFAALGFVLLVSLLFGVVAGEWIALSAYMHDTLPNEPTGAVLTAITNVTVFFQDWVMFFKHDLGESLQFTTNFWESPRPLWYYLLIPPGWSIGVELSFYIVAPFVAQRFTTVQLITAIIVAQIARFATYAYLGIANDPWTYRFFPFEFAHFAYGMLAARLYLGLQPPTIRLLRLDDLSRRVGSWQSYAVFAFILVVLLAANADAVRLLRPIGKALLPMGAELVLLVSYLVWIPLTTMLFAVTKTSAVDRFLGELSFPIYLIHYAIAMVASVAVTRGILLPQFEGHFTVTMSVAIAATMVVFAIGPFERWRKSKIESLNVPGEGALAAARELRGVHNSPS